MEIIEEAVQFMAEQDIGMGGEFLAYMALSGLPGPRRFVRNLLATAAAGETHDTEIDLVMVDTSGIYVIEAKEYSGWIFGRPGDVRWTQTLSNRRGGCEKHQFFNPLRQNFGHTRALRQNLAIFGEFPLYPVVVFSDNCVFRTRLSTPGEPVVHVRELAGTVTEIARKNNARLDVDEMELIYRHLRLLENPSARRKEEHEMYVQSMRPPNQNTA